MSGFGTVVTGTLVDGSLSVGDELELVPGGRRVRIRGLQQHNRQVDVASPGSRVAANLTGADRNEIRRGDVLARPDTLPATRRVDARVRVLADSPRPLRHGAELTLHTGTVEVGSRAIVLEGDAIDAGSEGWVQLYLERADRRGRRAIDSSSGCRAHRRRWPAAASPTSRRASIHATTPRCGNRWSDARPATCCRRSCASTRAASAVAALLKATLATDGGVDGLAGEARRRVDLGARALAGAHRPRSRRARRVSLGPSAASGHAARGAAKPSGRRARRLCACARWARRGRHRRRARWRDRAAGS